MQTRRTILTGSASATLTLLTGGGVAVAAPDTSHALPSAYDQLSKLDDRRASVGNVSGAAVELPAFLILAAQAPAFLLSIFKKAFTAFSSRQLNRAGSDYVDYCYETAEQELGAASRIVSQDVINDRMIARQLTEAISQDIAFGKRAIADNSSSLSVFRRQMAQLASQRELLDAEQKRARGGEAIYVPVSSQLSRRKTSAHETLQDEIDKIRTELRLLEAHADELRRLAFKYG